MADGLDERLHRQRRKLPGKPTPRDVMRVWRSAGQLIGLAVQAQADPKKGRKVARQLARIARISTEVQS